MVHYLFTYSNSLAFSVSVYTASDTTAISRSVFYYTDIPSGVIRRALSILILICFQGAFLRSSFSFSFIEGRAISKVVSIAQWSDPWSVMVGAQRTIASARPSVARTRSIVVALPPLCHVFVPLGSRLYRAHSLISSIIILASPYLTNKTSSPPHR